MEKSFLSFAATYPTWEPDSAAKQMLLSLGQAPPLRNGSNVSDGDCHPMQSAIAASLFPGAPRSAAALLDDITIYDNITIHNNNLQCILLL